MKVLDSLIALHFEWFTPAAMNVIASAAAEVSRSGDMAIRPKHLFLGFLSSAKGYSAKLVAEAGVRIEGLGFRPGEPLTDESTRQSEKKRPYRGTETRFAASSKRILQRATKMAKALKSYSVGTDHIMLAILEDPDSDLAVMFEKSRIDRGFCRAAIESYLLGNVETSQQRG